jgi:hypothetical protein
LSGESTTTRSTSPAKRSAAGRDGVVVGLERDHRPDDDAEGAQRVLGERELRPEVGRDALAGLVAGGRGRCGIDSMTWSVAAAMWVISGSRSSGDRRAYQAAHGADLAAVGARLAGWP